VFGEHQNNNLSVVDRTDDLISILRARGYIAWRNPALKSMPLQVLNERSWRLRRPATHS
jgi:hypothetical protein